MAEEPSAGWGIAGHAVNQGTLEAVGQIDEREQKSPLGLPGGHVAIALDAAPVVLEVRSRAQVAVVLLLQFGAHSIEPGLLRARGRRFVFK